MNKSLLVVLCVCFTGCVSPWEERPVAPSSLEGIHDSADQATAKSDAQQAKLDAEVKKIAGEVRANIQTAREANGAQSPGPNTTVVEGELNLADRKLSSAPVDTAELARASERKALVEQGKTLQAQQLYEDASKKADEAITQLATLRTERDEARRECDRARDAEKAAVKKALDDAELAGKEFAKRWDDREKDFAQQKKDLEDGIARQTQFYLTMGCYGLAVICVIIAGLLAYFSFQSGPVGIATLGKRIGLPSLFAMIFFALGRLTSQSWFWWRWRCGHRWFSGCSISGGR